jgi:hypothetical protein
MSATDILAEGLDSIEQRLSMEINKRYEGDQKLQDQITAFLKGLQRTWSSIDPMEGLAASAGTTIFNAAISELCSRAWLDENIRDNVAQFYAFKEDPSLIPGFLEQTGLSGMAQVSRLADENGNAYILQLLFISDTIGNTSGFILLRSLYAGDDPATKPFSCKSLELKGDAALELGLNQINSDRIRIFAGVVSDGTQEGKYNDKRASLRISESSNGLVELIGGFNEMNPLGAGSYLAVSNNGKLLVGAANGISVNYDIAEALGSNSAALVVTRGAEVLFTDASKFKQTWGSRVWLNSGGIKYLNNSIRMIDSGLIMSIPFDSNVWGITGDADISSGETHSNFGVYKPEEMSFLANEFTVVNTTAADCNFTYLTFGGATATDTIPAYKATKYLCVGYTIGQTSQFSQITGG